MNYQTAFEIGFRSFPWSGLLHPVPFILIGLLLFRVARGKQIYQAFGIIVAVFAMLFFLIAAMKLVPESIALRHEYRSGDSSVVDGIVQNFHPAPALGPANEFFSVNGVSFSYNALDLTPCFRNAPFRKGPISAGLPVRITYKNSCIQRVDIRR